MSHSCLVNDKTISLLLLREIWLMHGSLHGDGSCFSAFRSAFGEGAAQTRCAPGAYPADAFGALLRRLCRRSARRAGFDAAGAEGQRPTLVYDSCFESGGYEKTPAGNTQREAF